MSVSRMSNEWVNCVICTQNAKIGTNSKAKREENMWIFITKIARQLIVHGVTVYYLLMILGVKDIHKLLIYTNACIYPGYTVKPML